MSNISQLKRPQVIDQDIIDEIRGVLDAAERGEVTGLAFCADMADDRAFFRVTHYQNGWHMLGALEYAKDAVLGGMRAED